MMGYNSIRNASVSGVRGWRSTTMIGTQDLLIALTIGIFFFGAKKLPELSRSLGRALSEFKKGLEEPTNQPPAAPPPENPDTPK